MGRVPLVGSPSSSRFGFVVRARNIQLLLQPITASDLNDPITGEDLGGGSFSWTAAMALNWAAPSLYIDGMMGELYIALRDSRRPGPLQPDGPLQKAEEVIEAPQPVMIHPNLAELYRRRVADLERVLLDPELGSEAMDLIRSMITEIKIVPREDAEGVHLELAGDLARILHLCSTGSRQNAQAVGAGRLGASSYEVSVVAGRGFEPLTFRL